MKRFATALAMLFVVCSISAQNKKNTVNPIIGDESYVMLTGTQPDQYSDEHERVKAHLSYVENKLREKSVEGLTEKQKQNREKVLNHLRDYWSNGAYPKNYDYPDERRPCFIDRDGTICAVGYLIEKTAGLEVAQKINEKHQYDFLLDMHEPVIEAWAEENGFTMEECATIQPAYGSPPPPVVTQKALSTGYGTSSGVLGGANLAISLFNLTGRYGNTKAIAYLGFLTGGAQLVMGISNIKSDKTAYNGWNGQQYTTSYKAQNNLSYVNIAMGTTTMLTSALNLVLASKVKDKKSTVGLYSYPGLNNEMNVGFTVSRKL